MENYSVKIREASKELTAKERVAFKDITDAIKLDSAVSPSESLEIFPDFTVLLDVHNEKAEPNKDYEIFIVVAKDGQKYYTSSESFMKSYNSIAEEMQNESEEWGIKVYKVESKNYNGRYFLTCSII